MTKWIRAVAVPLVLAFAVTACEDAATGLDQTSLDAYPAFAKGGTPGPPDNGGGGSGDLAALGQMLFADADLSVNGDQSCQTCHEPSQGFAAPVASHQDARLVGAVVEGSVPGRFGDRKPPTAAYATLSPLFSSSGRNAEGGMFWDGRATGEVLGSPTADQALGPFLNPKEQSLPDMACVARVVSESGYLDDYIAVWGNEIVAISWPGDAGEACATPTEEPGEYVGLSGADRLLAQEVYHNVARSIDAFEATLNRFDSEFDAGNLTPQQELGLKLFDSSAKCGQCHETKGSRPLFTDFKFHNLGVPKNPTNPAFDFWDAARYDPGLFNHTGNAAHEGKFKTPTLRNVAMGDNRTYMHNGVLRGLVQVVDFYNTRDVLPVCTAAQLESLDPSDYGSTAFGGAGCWPPPEFGENLDTKRMGDLGLTADEVRAVAAFMEALTDR